MYFSSVAITATAVVLLLGLPRVSLAGVTTSSASSCKTALGKSSLQSVPTATTTTTKTTKTYTDTVTTTPTSTVTPKPKTTKINTTTTITTTLTAAAPPDQTSTSTTIQYETVSSYDTTTTVNYVLVTETVTSTDSETVIPTPAGFTPIQSEPYYAPKIKGRDLQGRSPSPSGSPSVYIKPNGSGKAAVVSPTRYPASVSCTKTLQPITTATVTKTAKASKTTLAAVTQTNTNIVTRTSTTTVMPAGVTSTITTVSTITSTETGTSTVTVDTTITATETLLIPGPTTYAACSNSNIASNANGGFSIGNTGTSGRMFLSYVPTPYDCCALCQQTTNCKASIFIYNSDFGGGNACFSDVSESDTCTPGQANGYDAYYTYSDQRSGVAVSNGPCGIIWNGGNYPDYY